MALGRKTGGRQKGTPNKITADIKALAQEHGPSAIATIINIMQTGENDGVRLAAAKELIDRGFGKAVQAIEADIEANVGIQVVTLPLDDKL
jgi:hypothetical protein